MNAPATAERVLLHPGDYRVSDRPLLMSTLLGSCVAVCLYDPIKRVMGMNHFLLAERRHAGDQPVLASEAGRYGIHAMELLINAMLRKGAQRSRLQAKAFGGGNVLGSKCTGEDGFRCVGTTNVAFIRDFLSRDRIPLVAADLGGNHGRQIHFSGDDYSVYVRQIPIQQGRQVIEQERLYWRESLESHEQPKSDVDFW